jgi:hypothetical protein
MPITPEKPYGGREMVFKELFMKRLFASGSLTILASLTAALPLLAAHKDVVPVERSSHAEIINTGSTNTTGYSVFVSLSGNASWVLGSGIHDHDGKQFFITRGTVSHALADKLFHDLKDAQPLSKLPGGHGVKSISFGTSLYIEYQGQRTPDLSFPGNAKAQVLAADAAAVAKALGLSNRPRRPLSFLAPAVPGHE